MKIFLFTVILIFFVSCEGNFKPISEDERKDSVGVGGDSSSSSAEFEDSSSSEQDSQPSSSSLSTQTSSSKTASSNSTTSSSSVSHNSSSSIGEASSSSYSKCVNYFDPNSKFCDERDGKLYAYVNMLLNSKIWMAENLNYITSGGGSMCYSDNLTNCNDYGRLYNWTTAKTACPEGWRLPTDSEWNSLTQYSLNALLFGQDNASNFSAKLGGECTSTSSCNKIGVNGFWWTSTDDGGGTAYRFVMPSMDFGNAVNKSYYFSVRCVKD